jgi:hypothetical protein
MVLNIRHFLVVVRCDGGADVGGEDLCLLRGEVIEHEVFDGRLCVLRVQL